MNISVSSIIEGVAIFVICSGLSFLVKLARRETKMKKRYNINKIAFFLDISLGFLLMVLALFFWADYKAAKIWASICSAYCLFCASKCFLRAEMDFDKAPDKLDD